VLRRDRADSTYYYITDLAGNVVALLAPTGTGVRVANQYAYTPFGTLESSSETVVNSLRFAAREYDPETNLYYFRERYYDAVVGRFVSEDPTGQEDGGVNPFAFVSNQPLTDRDPTGTCDQGHGAPGTYAVCIGAYITWPYIFAGNNRGGGPWGGSFKLQMNFTFDPLTGGWTFSYSYGTTFGIPPVEWIKPVPQVTWLPGYGWKVDVFGAVQDAPGAGTGAYLNSPMGGFPGVLTYEISFTMTKDGTLLTGLLVSDGFPSWELVVYGADGSVTFTFGTGQDWIFDLGSAGSMHRFGQLHKE
jgi:RHS repeat-associated protein